MSCSQSLRCGGVVGGVAVVVAAGQHHNTTPGLPAAAAAAGAGAGAGAGAAPTIIIIQYLGCLAGGWPPAPLPPAQVAVLYSTGALHCTGGTGGTCGPPPDCAPDTEYLHLEEAEWLLLAAAW